jgi:UDP-GlcNAc:undecaprenyl-phosphate GlcNAc-1-phosphate transferase
MGAETARVVVFVAAALAMSALAVLVLARVAPALGLIDAPGGRKTHGRPIPLVGGLAIYMTFFAAAWALGVAQGAPYFLLAVSVVIAVGLWDDVTDLPPRLKFVIQISASALMIWGAGVQLYTVGDLLGWRPITIFALVGVSNAVNMMDGLDGVAGSVALVAFAWYAAVAGSSGLEVQFKTALIFCGAIAGFLLFNLRFPWQRHARVFLGDAGSLMIGFALGWFAIDLTQGDGRTFPPIAALWVLLLPLADCVSLMTRRLLAGRSPFVADRHHIHHYLLARGLSHGQTLGVIVAASTLAGAVGYFGWRLGVPEPALFWPFFFGFFAYHVWITRAWKKLDLQRLEVETGMFAPPVPLEDAENEVLPTS